MWRLPGLRFSSSNDSSLASVACMRVLLNFPNHSKHNHISCQQLPLALMVRKLLLLTEYILGADVNAMLDATFS